MSRKILIGWIFGVPAAAFLALGVIQLFRGHSHGWILLAGAALIGAGLVLMARKPDWGELLVLWGLTTGVAWLVGLLGRDDSFPLAGWITGMGGATFFFFQGRGKTSAQAQGEKLPQRPPDGAGEL